MSTTIILTLAVAGVVYFVARGPVTFGKDVGKAAIGVAEGAAKGATQVAGSLVNDITADIGNAIMGDDYVKSHQPLTADTVGAVLSGHIHDVKYVPGANDAHAIDVLRNNEIERNRGQQAFNSVNHLTKCEGEALRLFDPNDPSGNDFRMEEADLYTDAADLASHMRDDGHGITDHAGGRMCSIVSADDGNYAEHKRRLDAARANLSRPDAGPPATTQIPTPPSPQQNTPPSSTMHGEMTYHYVRPGLDVHTCPPGHFVC